MANHFFALIHKELGNDYQMGLGTQPETLRISVITYQLKESNVTMEIPLAISEQNHLGLSVRLAFK